MGERIPESEASIRRSPRVVLVLLTAAVAVMAFESLHGAPGGSRAEGRSVRAAERTPPASSPRAPAPVSHAAPPGIRRPPAPPPPREPAVPVDPETLDLTRVLFSEGDEEATFAVIGGRAVRRGERIGGHLVHRIERDRVLLGPEGEIVLEVVDRER